jgi:hypothetical protein
VRVRLVLHTFVWSGTDLLTLLLLIQWPEITRELLDGQTAMDRPDLVSRVFKMKADQFIEDLFKGGVMGSVRARVHTIEFQKRCSPTPAKIYLRRLLQKRCSPT